MDFDEAVGKFLETVGRNMKAYYQKHSPNLEWSDIPGDRDANYSPAFVEGGRKYLKVSVRGKYTHSVYCFIEVSTGSILKAESWKKPSLIGRGLSIYKPETYQNADPFGSWLYLR